MEENKDKIIEVQAEDIIVKTESQKNGEIVAQNQTNKITTNNFKRVDMDNPQSILAYGNEVKDAINDLLMSTAQMSVNQEEKTITDDELGKIVSFKEALDNADKEAAKKEGFLTKITKKIMIAAGSKSVKEKEDMKTYSGRYTAYCQNLDEVGKEVEIMKQNSLNDIETRKIIAEQMKPLIEKMEEMVKVGREDREKYDKETLLLGQNDTSMDGQYLVQRRSGTSDVFETRLNKLEQAVVSYKGQLQEYTIEQHNDMIAVMDADSYLRDIAPLLKAQGSVQIFNKIQGNRIETLQRLNEASNLAIQNNAKELEENTAKAVDLMVNGGLSMETLSIVQESLQRGIDIIKEGKIQQKQKAENDKKILSQINELLDQNQKDILELIEQNAGAINSLESKQTPYAKRLTLKMKNGRK